MSRPRLRFAKMSGAGNDFVVLGPQGIAELPDDVGGWVRRVCRRGLSVGADGVLLVRTAAMPSVATAAGALHGLPGSRVWRGTP
jgi:diaminopimelate epimerase